MSVLFIGLSSKLFNHCCHLSPKPLNFCLFCSYSSNSWWGALGLSWHCMFKLKVLKMAIKYCFYFMSFLMGWTCMMGRGRGKVLIQVKPSHQANAATLLESFSYHRPEFHPKCHFSTEVFSRGSGLLPPNKKPFCQLLIKSPSWCSDGRQFSLKQALLVLADW